MSDMTIQLHVVKTGVEMFDALHAYGLAVLIAEATGLSVRLSSAGCMYIVESPPINLLPIRHKYLSAVLELPTIDEATAALDDTKQVSATVGNLDGLLAALATSRGKRVISVSDVVNEQQRNATAFITAVDKVDKAITRWSVITERLAGTSHYVPNIVRSYHQSSLNIPVMTTVKTGNDIAVTIPLDPALGFSTRSSYDNAPIAEKTNVTIHGTSYAPVLAYIGAARFLRAQRVATDLVNLYVPLVHEMVVKPGTTLPILLSRQLPSDQACILHSVRLWQRLDQQQVSLESIAYQIIRNQGLQQFISVERGRVDLGRLFQSVHIRSSNLINRWGGMLQQAHLEIGIDITHLVEALLRSSSTAWIQHLRDIALQTHRQTLPHSKLFYTLQDVQEVTRCMTTVGDIPSLGLLFQERHGTLRFGHALRQIGSHNPADLRDVAEIFESVHTRDQFLEALTRIVPILTLTHAKSQFAILPSDHDLKLLLDDVEHYGARTIANLLIIVSALAYPPNASKADDTDSPAAT